MSCRLALSLFGLALVFQSRLTSCIIRSFRIQMIETGEENQFRKFKITTPSFYCLANVMSNLSLFGYHVMWLKEFHHMQGSWAL